MHTFTVSTCCWVKLNDIESVNSRRITEQEEEVERWNYVEKQHGRESTRQNKISSIRLIRTNLKCHRNFIARFWLDWHKHETWYSHSVPHSWKFVLFFCLFTPCLILWQKYSLESLTALKHTLHFSPWIANWEIIRWPMFHLNLNELISMGNDKLKLQSVNKNISKKKTEKIFNNKRSLYKQRAMRVMIQWGITSTSIGYSEKI